MIGLNGQTVAAMATPAKKAKVAWAKVVKLFLKPLGYMCVHTSWYGRTGKNVTRPYRKTRDTAVSENPVTWP